MTLEEFKDLYPDTVVFRDPDYETALIGVSAIDGRAVYDYNKMVDYLIEHDGMGPDEASEFVDYNAVGSCCGRDTPIVIYPVEQ